MKAHLACLVTFYIAMTQVIAATNSGGVTADSQHDALAEIDDFERPPVEARRPQKLIRFVDGKGVELSAEESRKIEANITRFRRAAARERNALQAAEAAEHHFRVKEAFRQLRGALRDEPLIKPIRPRGSLDSTPTWQ